MMSRCRVRGCRNGSGGTDSSVTFHPFPAERAAAETWATLCEVSREERSRLLKDLERGDAGTFQLCSLHFEEEDFETNPDDKIRGVKLKQGAEPTRLLHSAQTDNTQENASSPAPGGPRGQAPAAASSCSSCTCARNSAAAQVPGCGRSSNIRLPAESGPQVSLCSSGATVVRPQPGVSQIVLNFCEQGRGLTLDHVSTESAPQCPGGCHCAQRVVKQVVLIFVDHPRESHAPPSSPSSQESAPTLSSSTQTGEKDGKSETNTQGHPETPVHHPLSPQKASLTAAVHVGAPVHPEAPVHHAPSPQASIHVSTSVHPEAPVLHPQSPQKTSHPAAVHVGSQVHPETPVHHAPSPQASSPVSTQVYTETPLLHPQSPQRTSYLATVHVGSQVPPETPVLHPLSPQIKSHQPAVHVSTPVHPEAPVHHAPSPQASIHVSAAVQPETLLHHPSSPRRSSHPASIHISAAVQPETPVLHPSSPQKTSHPAAVHVSTLVQLETPVHHAPSPQASIHVSTLVHPETPVLHPSSPQKSSHPASVHVSTQTEPTAASMEASETQDCPEVMDVSSKTSEVPDSPGGQICTSSDPSTSESCERTPQICPEPVRDEGVQNNVTREQPDINQAPEPDKPQPAPECLKEGQRGVGAASNVDAEPQPNDDQAAEPLRNCDPKPEDPSQPPLCADNLKTCRQLCLDPSINQYVGDLLAQYCGPSPPGVADAASSAQCRCVSAQYCRPSPPGVADAASSAQCRCVSAQRCVKQIVLNFVEPQRAAGSRDAAPPRSAADLSSPVVVSRQHQETQTRDDRLQQTPQSSKSVKSPPRPLKSRSCPPALIAHTEETSRPVHPTNNEVTPPDVHDGLESKVTYEDVVIYFSKEEWELLVAGERDLYREVMSDNYQSLVFVGFLKEKPNLVLRIENEEENLWVGRGPQRRIHHHEDDLHFLQRDEPGVSMLADQDDATHPSTGQESAESSSHLGALMRLVNEIPGFLLGSSVTDGSCSPACSTEDLGSIRPLLEVKTEGHSPACSPASAHVPLRETPEMAAGPGVHRSLEQRKVVTKAEKAEVAVSQSSRYSTPVSHPPVSPSCIKSDPGSSNDSVHGRLQIKQEFPAHLIPPLKPIIALLPKSPGSREHPMPEHGRRPCSAGGTSLSRSTAASPRNPPSLSPASPNHGMNCTAPGELKIKIKQEDSGSERDFVESPVYGRRVYHTPGSSAPQAEREHWRLAASPLRSPADAPLGSSPLHRLVNCLKEISRPRPYTLSAPRWGADMSRICADASVRAVQTCREATIPAPQPNPFTVAVTNGAAQLRGVEPRTPDSLRAGRDETHPGNVPLSALGKCLEKIPSRVPSGQNIRASPNSEDPRRAELGVKRTHSDDLSCRPGVFGGGKRPALEASGSSRVVSSCSPGHRDLWRPPEELPRGPSEDLPAGSSHLMSVMNCVRKIPGCRPSPSIHVTSAGDPGRPCTQGVATEVKDIKVKREKEETSETPRHWIQPLPSPDVPKPPGASATNVHLTGLMRLMEEIPMAESSNPGRAMYSIAVGHSLARRMDRAAYLSACNDDSSFQAELNDSTIASVDSVYSDDTSWSSENVDPSYSAIGGLQRVVSEFAELGSVSPLVAVAAPPALQDGVAPKKPKEASAASAPRLSEMIRRSPRDAVGVGAGACSAENGEAAFAAICGLQKVVHGFVEQECVSPITAVRNRTPSAGPRDAPGRKAAQEEEAASPLLQGSSPAPVSRFLYDTGKWLSEPDSSYSALSGLQKVVNGFSEMSCVSPFSAVSTPVSEGPVELPIQRRSDAQGQDLVSSTLGGQKNVSNGGPDAGCLSPMTVASNVSSESDAGPAAKRRCRRSDDDDSSQRSSVDRQRPAAMAAPDQGPGSSRAPSAHCIDLTQEEEPCRSARSERLQKSREGPSLFRPSIRPEDPVGNRGRTRGRSRIPCNQLIDLTEEDETLTKPKGPSSEVARKLSHTGVALNPAEKHRPLVNVPKAACGKQDRPLDPGPSGSSRGAVPAVNEHLSGLEKLLKGVPTFTPATRPSGQAWSGSWWFKSTSSHET